MNVAVVISRGAIIAVGRADKLIKKFPNHQIINFPNAVFLPGLVNLHVHLELPPLLDTIKAGNLPDWVLNLIRAKRELTTSDYAQSARVNVRSLTQTGSTTVAEICTHNISPAILKQSGLRSTIFHEIISMNPALPLPRISALFSKKSGIIRNGVSPHAPHTVSEQVLREIKRVSLKKETPICMHVGESKDEIRLLQGKKSGFEKLYRTVGWDRSWTPMADSPFEYLAKLGLLNPGFLAVHAVYATERDIAIMKKTKISVAHCPRSNRNIGAGRMPLKKILDAVINVGIGTDSLASSESLNLWDEMRYAYKIHKRDGVTPRDIFQMATINGAKALGMDDMIGTIEPGKRADIIAVPLPRKNTGDIYSDLLRETKSCIMAMVDGKIIYRQ